MPAAISTYQGINLRGAWSTKRRLRHYGWYIGGGFEWKISPGWTAGVEYRHYEFEDRFRSPIPPAAQQFRPIGIDSTRRWTSITARVSWTFHRPEAKPLK